MRGRRGIDTPRNETTPFGHQFTTPLGTFRQQTCVPGIAVSFPSHFGRCLTFTGLRAPSRVTPPPTPDHFAISGQRIWERAVNLDPRFSNGKVQRMSLSIYSPVTEKQHQGENPWNGCGMMVNQG